MVIAITDVTKGREDYIAGVVSGLGKIVAGYPFDTVKARVQCGKFHSPMEALWKTVVYESPFALYQGVSMPTMYTCVAGGFVFSGNEAIKRWFLSSPSEKNSEGKLPTLTYPQMFLAGAGGGTVAGLLMNPIEVLKVNLQVINKREKVTVGSGVGELGPICRTKLAYTPRQAITALGLIRELGFVDLWAGLTSHVIREAGTFGVFFSVNEFLKVRIANYSNENDRKGEKDTTGRGQQKLSITQRILASWVAAIVGWTPMFPVDQIKTRMQLHNALHYKAPFGFFRCMGEIYWEQGFRVGFWKGLTPCLLRAGPAYSAQLILFEYMQSVLHQ